MQIPAPLEIGSAVPTDMKERSKEILTLTKMNWNSERRHFANPDHRIVRAPRRRIDVRTLRQCHAKLFVSVLHLNDERQHSSLRYRLLCAKITTNRILPPRAPKQPAITKQGSQTVFRPRLRSAREYGARADCTCWSSVSLLSSSSPRNSRR